MATAAHPRRRLLELVQARLSSLGRCPTCGAGVRPSDEHVRLRGDVFHARCARYGGRAPSL